MAKRGFTVRKLFTVKGYIKYATPGGGLLQRSKSARKIALLSAAAAGAYVAAPYVATAGKAGAVYGRSLYKSFSPKLSDLMRNNRTPGISDTAPPPYLRSPTEDAFYGGTNSGLENPNAAASRLPYGSAGAVGLGASSCSGQASSAAQASVDPNFWQYAHDFIVNNFSIFDIIFLSGVVSLVAVLSCVEVHSIYKFSRYFRSEIGRKKL